MRVVSLPSWELFNKHSAAYQEGALPTAVRARIAIEAGQPIGWEHYVGLTAASSVSTTSVRVRLRPFFLKNLAWP